MGEGESIVPSDEFLDGFNDYWPDFRAISEELPEKIRIADGIQGNMWLFIQEFRDEEVDKTEFKAALDRLDSVRQEFEALQGNLAMLHDFNNPFELLHLETAIELLEKDLLPPHSELLLMGTTSWKEKAQEVLGKVAEESGPWAGSEGTPGDHRTLGGEPSHCQYRHIQEAALRLLRACLL